MDIPPKQSIPRALVQKTSAKGSKITLGDRTGFVKEEQGRGSYGEVVLVESKDDDIRVVALKAQAPMDCLALEYIILRRPSKRELNCILGRTFLIQERSCLFVGWTEVCSE